MEDRSDFSLSAPKRQPPCNTTNGATQEQLLTCSMLRSAEIIYYCEVYQNRHFALECCPSTEVSSFLLIVSHFVCHSDSQYWDGSGHWPKFQAVHGAATGLKIGQMAVIVRHMKLKILIRPLDIFDLESFLLGMSRDADPESSGRRQSHIIKTTSNNGKQKRPIILKRVHQE